MSIKISCIFFFATMLFCPMSQAQNPLDMVNLFMGTSGDHGQLSPAATTPFSMIAVGPDSEPRQHPGYDYAVTLTSGISVNRLSGTGGAGCGGNLSIRPADFNIRLNRIPTTEKATPGFYSVSFDNGTTASLTASKRAAIERYSFGQNGEHALFLNMNSGFTQTEVTYEIKSNHEIQGFVRARNTCDRGHYQQSFSLQTSRPFSFREISENHLKLAFDEPVVEVRIGLSSVSPAEASQELQTLANLSFDDIAQQARQQWQNLLQAITVSGSTAEERTIFYTSLYRACLSPHEVAPRGSFYRGTDGNLHLSSTHAYYSSWSMWDTYRCKFTLLSLIAPDVMQDAACSLVDLFSQGKAGWSTEFEPTPTVRSEHSAVILLDCFRRGLTAMNLQQAYEGMKKELSLLPMSSPDQRLEAVSDYWAVAQIADITNHPDDAVHLSAHARNLFEQTWKKEFMNITPEYVKMKDNGLYQGTRWQYRWAAPFYMSQMIEWTGREKLIEQLSSFFSQSLFNQGNEPDIHTPYIFDLLGAPLLTQKIVTKLLTDNQMVHKYGGNAEFPTPYVGRAFRNSPDGYMAEMDEDDGTMSAWFAFSTMGFYPLIVGSDEYVLSAPLFSRIILHQPGGKDFTIETSGRRHLNAPIKKVLLNGVPLTNFIIHQKDITNGGHLLFRF
jgi:putative alpha-1,2-mannosidase